MLKMLKFKMRHNANPNPNPTEYLRISQAEDFLPVPSCVPSDLRNALVDT